MGMKKNKKIIATRHRLMEKSSRSNILIMSLVCTLVSVQDFIMISRFVFKGGTAKVNHQHRLSLFFSWDEDKKTKSE